MLGLGLVVQHVREWPVASQQQARRNAMLAATACAARRAEREDVADFLAARFAPAPMAPMAPTAPTGHLAQPHRAARG